VLQLPVKNVGPLISQFNAIQRLKRVEKKQMDKKIANRDVSMQNNNNDMNSLLMSICNWIERGLSK
jgi:hypothetical protein